MAANSLSPTDKEWEALKMKKTFVPLHLGIGRWNRRAWPGDKSLSATEKGCFNTEPSILARFSILLDLLFQWVAPISPTARVSELRLVWSGTLPPSPCCHQPMRPAASSSPKPRESTCFLHAHSLYPKFSSRFMAAAAQLVFLTAVSPFSGLFFAEVTEHRAVPPVHTCPG